MEGAILASFWIVVATVLHMQLAMLQAIKGLRESKLFGLVQTREEPMAILVLVPVLSIWVIIQYLSPISESLVEAR